MIRRSLLMLAVAAPLLGCRGGSPSNQAAGGRRQMDSGTVAVNPSTTAGRVALELWQLRPGVTLAEWKGLHPDEPILGTDTTVLATQHLGRWCAYAVAHSPPNTTPMLRAAYFYAPPPPADLAIPDSGSIDLARQCVLGLVWVNLQPRDSARGVLLADSIHRELHRLYGAEARTGVQFYGSAFWGQVGLFRKDSVVAIAAVREPGVDNSPATRMHLVTAFAYLPSAGISATDSSEPDIMWTPVDTFPLDSAAKIAALDTSLYRRLRGLLKEGPSPTRDSLAAKAAADSLVRPLERWVHLATPLPNERRAAALYVADRVLGRALCTYGLCDRQDDPALAPLKTLGAAFRWSEQGATNVYTRGWLTQARGLSRDSPLGQRLLLAQLNGALDYSGICIGGPEGFRRVIETGERYLKRVPTSPIAADVHFLVGEAWGDVVALAHGAGGEYADSTKYRAEAQGAARQALSHYIAATRAGRANPAARAAWEAAFRLRAGLPPRRTRFFCVYD